MTGFINRMLGLFIAFVLLVFVPMLISICLSDLKMQRGTLNEVANLIEKVTDTGVLTDAWLKDFYTGMSSHGAKTDIKITRQELVVNPLNPDATGNFETYSTYTPNEDIMKWNQGDIIQVEVHYLSESGIQRVVYSILKMFIPENDFKLAGMVRN